jgi:ribosomal VAR1-like protein
LRFNLNEAYSTKKPGLKVAPSKSSDVIYEYLKTFSKYRNRKNGVLINFKQHIAYNFNSKNLLLREVEPLINNSLKTNKSTNAVPVTPVTPFTNAIQLEKEKSSSKEAKTTKNINKIYLLKKPLLGLYPDSTKNTPIPPFANTQSPEEPNAPTGVQREIAKDLLLRLNLRLNRLNRLNGVSGETGYNRKGNNILKKYSYKLLFYFFKSMYCLINKPVFIFTQEKVVIQLFYFLNIPKFKVFKWYSIFRIKRIIQKREALIKQNKKKRKSWKKDKFNLHSVAKLAHKLNHNKNLSSIHTLNSDGRKYNNPKYGRKNKKKKVKWKVARTLIRLKNKRTNVKNILFNLHKYNLFRVFSLKFKLICEILNNKFNKPVELQLIRIHRPYLDSNILVNLLSLNIKNKTFKTNVQIHRLFQKRVVKSVYNYQNKSVNFIPTYLSGINIRIGGRLMREPLIPRISKKKFERGASSIGKVNYLDSASITKKNRKGSYTLTISSGQNFF